MGRSAPVYESQMPSRKIARHGHEKKHRNALTGKRQALLVAEQALRKGTGDLLLHQSARSMEFEHRLFNGLQMVASMLLQQCRTATPTAAAQLNIAAGRIAAFGSVHRRLQLVDCQDTVEIKTHLQLLCDDLASLLFQEQAAQTIIVQGSNCEIPATLAIPIGLIVNELITNSAKYARTDITVRFETTPLVCHSISVLDDGPGLPGGFDPASSKGLGMQIVLALVKEIGGELRFLVGDNGRGTRVTVTFHSVSCGTAPAALLSKRTLTPRSV
jgi:two-component sensor histidine kinase